MMTVPPRSAHLTVYGLVGVAMYLVVGVLVFASSGILRTGWVLGVGSLWVVGAAGGAWLWRRTVWVPLLGSLVVATVWAVGFFSSR
jgi:hypothetical protein